MATASGSSNSSSSSPSKHQSHNHAGVRMPAGSSTAAARRPLGCFERPTSNIRFAAAKPTATTPLSSSSQQQHRRCRRTSGAGKASTMDNGGKSTSLPSRGIGPSSSDGEKGVFCMADFFESIPESRDNRIIYTIPYSTPTDKSTPLDTPSQANVALVNLYLLVVDYNDINHLSEHDFYGKLDGLKRKQAELNEACFSRQLGPTITVDVVPPLMAVNSCDEEATCQPTGTDDDRDQRRRIRRCKSVDSSRQSATSPFRITQREEEQKILRELMLESRCAFRPDERTNAKGSTRKSARRKTHTVPATSKYPMYDQILADQEKRSQLVKLNSMLELQAKIQPFHFATDKPPLLLTADNDLSEHDPLHSGRQYSPTPDPFAFQPPAKSRRFRARACPRKLFSNYFYHKMWEEEQFRGLNHRLRADEMLRLAATPPSMRKHRKKTAFHDQCIVPVGDAPTTASASDRSLSATSSQRGRKRCGANKRPSKRSVTSNVCGPNFVTTGTQPFRFETTRRSVNRKVPTSSVADSANTPTTLSVGRAPQFLRSTPVPIYPAARPNLAANLRAEWSRKKICDVTCDRTPANARHATAASSEQRHSWGVRKMPGWKSLYYDHTNDEDISLRLSTRRAEERLRNEEHAISMEMMRQRVRATPLLLEGATVLPTTATAGSHRLRCNVMPVGHASCQGGRRSIRARSVSAGAVGNRRVRCGRSTAETAGTDGYDDSGDEM